MTFPPITITDSTPFTFRWSDTGLKDNVTGVLEVWVNAASADVYYGDVPGPALSLLNAKTLVGRDIISYRDLTISSLSNNVGGDVISPGYVFSCTDDAADDGKYVVAVDRVKQTVKLNAVLTINQTDTTTTFTPPAITSSNGMPILQGTSKAFVADRDNRFLEAAMRFVVATGQTAVIRLAYKNL